MASPICRMEGEYPNDPIRPYTQTEYNLLGDWNVTGKLAARGRIGYVQRENDILTERDFSGLTGRLSAEYLASGKTTLTAAIYREIENAYESFASYLINTGGSLGAEWTASAKLTVRADVSFENRVYEGGFVTLIGPQRDDDTLAGSLSLTYAPVPMATFPSTLLRAMLSKQIRPRSSCCMPPWGPLLGRTSIIPTTSMSMVGRRPWMLC